VPFLSSIQILVSHFISEQVCGVRPSYSKGGKRYPTCGLSCADKLKANNKSKANTGSSPAGSSRLMCVVSFIVYNIYKWTSYPVSEQVCGVLPSYSKGGKKYPTCSLSCADRLKVNQKLKANSGSGSTDGSRLMCVVSFFLLRNLQIELLQDSHSVSEQVCSNRPSYSNGTKRYPTCGLTCAEKLAFGGGPHNACEVSLTLSFPISVTEFPDSTAIENQNSRTIRIVAPDAETMPELPVLSAVAAPRTANTIFAAGPVRTLR